MSKIRQLIGIAAIGFVPVVASFTTADATTCIKHPDWPQCVDHSSTTTTTTIPATTTTSPPVTSSVPPTVPTPPPTTTAVPSVPPSEGTAPTPPRIGIQRELPATGLDPVAALVVVTGTICAGAFFLALARSRQTP